MDNLQYGLMRTAAPKGTLFEFPTGVDDITTETGLSDDIMAAFDFLKYEFNNARGIP